MPQKNINGWIFIPSGGFDLFEKMLAKQHEEKVDVLYDRTLYGTDKQNMSKEKTDKFIYPCVYTITKRDGIKLFYSSIKHSKTEKKDMFVPKVIWSNGLGTYPIVDVKGEYGLTQFSYAIVDTIHNLKHIEDALNNPKFIELMEYVKFQDHKYNYKVISIFKKDFWKTFENPKSLKKLNKKIFVVPATEASERPLTKKLRKMVLIDSPEQDEKITIEKLFQDNQSKGKRKSKKVIRTKSLKSTRKL